MCFLYILYFVFCFKFILKSQIVEILLLIVFVRECLEVIFRINIFDLHDKLNFPKNLVLKVKKELFSREDILLILLPILDKSLVPWKTSNERNMWVYILVKIGRNKLKIRIKIAKIIKNSNEICPVEIIFFISIPLFYIWI